MPVKSIKSSGNVFADIGLPNADEHMVKAHMVRGIAQRIEKRKMTQAQVSKLIGLAQPDVSKLLRGNFSGYSYERLFGFLVALGSKVTINVSSKKKAGDRAIELQMGQ